MTPPLTVMLRGSARHPAVQRSLAALQTQEKRDHEVVVHPPAGPNGPARGHLVALMEAGDEPVPGWGSAVCGAVDGSKSWVVRWGALGLGDDGSIRRVVGPGDVVDRIGWRRGFLPGTVAVSRDLMEDFGTLDPGAFAEAIRRACAKGRAHLTLLPSILVRKRRRSPNTNPDPFPQPERGRPALVSVILPVRNGLPHLAGQLAALSAQGYRDRWELVVADNGSTDGSVALARGWQERFPRLRVIDASARTGAYAARNAGVRAATGDLLAFCDDDDIVAPHWLEALVDRATGSEMVGGALETERLNEPASRHDRSMPRSGLIRIDGQFLPFATGNNVAVWRDVLGWLGGWNQEYGSGGDVELSWRAQLCGFHLTHAPEAVVHYRYRARLPERLRQVWQYTTSEVLLARDFRWAGAPHHSLARRAKLWGWDLIHLPDVVRGPQHRRRWLRHVTRNTAALSAALRQRGPQR